MSSCVACGAEIQGKGMKHHVSYFPERMVQVDKRCHRLIHQTDDFPELRPTAYDSLKFYGPLSGMEKTIKVEVETWKTLAQIKLDKGLDSFDAVIAWLLKK